jgi:hypothetical protein
LQRSINVKVRVIALAIVFALALAATGLNAQEPPRASLHVWSDQFGGVDGATFYPQYGWSVKIPTGTMSGFGFAEVAPYEPFFTNHLVVYTPSAATWFSVHTETGGNPNKGKHFFQIGPRFNLTNAIPALKKPMDHLFVAVLPRYEGVRPNNLLVAGATNPFKVTKNLKGSIEGFRRFFPHGAYYGEYWVLVHPKPTPRLSLGAFILNDSSSHTSVGFGARFSLF